mmetsp:Transcript_125081/g.359117  ORF Transcript_125081/g.359117 Transcript_125081/m.359117 type:complete len:442 (-) Transcript_125081:162-1487(-)|eukprot:CAMPEP_0170288814 /NCGR_PEP_ID=MMETSP0116_2-20130129/44469_1 /TAXON_ID=400756 /ORGANISM="Durinskia baltica, Strain CSIRO CS-38" /LENGTH=441 /DNA_ID=CAMNT_0010540241 /DNA_START=43 /DNA_END=1368 /DNA_ORIENTATION=-
MVRRTASRRPILSASLVVWTACCAVRFLAPPPAFVPGGAARPNGARAPLRGMLDDRLSQSDRRRMWQEGLDVAFLKVDSSITERFAGLRQVLLSPGEVAGSLREAALAISSNKLSVGSAKALDALFPPGTQGRADLEGMLAVARQVPEIMGDVIDRSFAIVPELSQVNTSAVAPDLDEVREHLKELLTPEGLSEGMVRTVAGVANGITGMANTAVDSLRPLPKGLQEPAYEVYDRGDGFEVRRYQGYVLAKRKTSLHPASHELSSADPFTSLAVHLLSGPEGPSLNMSLPMRMEYKLRHQEPLSAAFVLPPGTEVANFQDSGVELVQVPEQLVAIRSFPGIATAAEVRRQFEQLVQSFSEEGIYSPLEAGAFCVLQYNPPYTIPWRRRNEIAVEVAYNKNNADRVARAKAAAAAAAEAFAQARDEAEGVVEIMLDAEVIGD